MKVAKLLGLLACATCMCGVAQSATPNSSVKRATPVSVSFEKVALEDDFWRPRLLTQKHTLVPFAMQKTEPAVENLRRTGAFLRGEKPEPLLHWPFYVASDLFKVMEGAAYLLTVEPDAELERQMDEIIDIIASAQKADGYLYEHHTMPEECRYESNYWGSGKTPYSNVLFSHELYNMGHMYEAAVAYYRATGKRKWLDVAEKSARHINKVFFEGDSAYNDGKPVNQAPGHQEIELALIKMFEVMGDSLYLDMAIKFIDIRGVTYVPDGVKMTTLEYAQQHLPVREQREAVGHAVRATYLYSGMADVVAQTGDTTLLPALESVWADIVDRKMHITGGLGAISGIEGFGPAYVLPNKETYDETCSAVGNVMFNYRMYLMSRDAKYIDVAEIALFNNVLAGVNLDGNRFFYVNPLEADGRKTFNHGHSGRAPWFATACCPSNLARLIPQVAGMLYSYTDDEILCGFYAGNSTSVPLAQGAVKLRQTTDYPFGGKVSIEIDPGCDNMDFTLWLRVPTWCVGDGFVPGELYRYADKVRPKAVIAVNGKRVRSEAVNGLVPVRRQWSAGDVVTLEMDMPIRYSIADERVKADSNRVCLTRGPLVFCAEAVDNEYIVTDYYVEKIGAKGVVDMYADGIVKGIPYIEIDANVAMEEGSESSKLRLLPYYAWNNRGNDVMMVWFARDRHTVLEGKPQLASNVASVKATHTYGNDDVNAIVDGLRPVHSRDNNIPRWTSWAQKGKMQQVEIELKKRQPIENVQIYWYDDNGGVQAPVSWSMEYLCDGEWKTFVPYVTDRFGVTLDQFNMVHPETPIEAEALRLHIVPKPDATVGILELVIE